MSDFTKRNEDIKVEFAEISAALSDESTKCLRDAVDGLIHRGLMSKEHADAKLSALRGEVKQYLDTLLDEYNQNITNS